jgi:hypothetical protein
MSNFSMPVRSHPLSNDVTPTRGRRTRANHDPESVRPSSNYFTLKAQLDQENEFNSGTSTRDGSVRGKSGQSLATDKASSQMSASSSSLAVMWDRPDRQPPVFIVGPPTEHMSRSPRPNYSESVFLDQDGEEPSPQILGTKWHEYSDEAIQTAISNISVSESPSNASGNPYHTALRVLSSALQNLSKIRTELEESRRLLLEKQSNRRANAEQLVANWQPTERDVARRVIQSIFADEDVVEPERQVQKRRSYMVSMSESSPELFYSPIQVLVRVFDGSHCGRSADFSQCA